MRSAAVLWCAVVLDRLGVKTGFLSLFPAFPRGTVRPKKIGAYDLNRSDYNLKQNGANEYNRPIQTLSQHLNTLYNAFRGIPL